MEKWDLYDESRKPLGKLLNRGDKLPTGEYHTVVGIWVVNDKNEILLTLRAPEKEEYPNLWENTGGSALAGETSRQSAVRELYEETGIRIRESDLAYLGTNKRSSAFVDLYAVRKNIEIGELVFQEGETVGAQWVTLAKLNQMAASGDIAKPISERLELLRKEFEDFIFRGNLKSREYILFDLDGTITDSAMGIINSVIYAAEKLGLDVRDRDALYCFVGPPLWESFERFFKLSREQADVAVKYFRIYYHDRGVYENEVYADVNDLLKQLEEKGKKMVLATCKAEYYARVVLEHFGLNKYFSFIAGSNLDGTRAEKEEVIAYALNECGIGAQQAVMIGDREHDIKGAKKNSIDTVGVLYGYGDYKELTDAGAMYMVRDVKELAGLLMQA